MTAAARKPVAAAAGPGGPERPCVCGHRATLHAPSCQDAACACRQFRPDQSPEFLLRLGIRAGEWQFITVPQLQFLMRPEQDQTTRVWACGMLHSIGQRSRLAVKIGPNKNRVPLTPTNIVNELNAFDPIARLTVQNLRRSMEKLEGLGAARRAGRTKGNVRLFFYARPRKRNFIVGADYKGQRSPLFSSGYSDVIILHIQGTLVKSFRNAIRKNLQLLAPEIVVEFDYETAIDVVLEPLLKLLESAYLDIISKVCPEKVQDDEPAEQRTDESGEPGPGVADSTPPDEADPREQHQDLGVRSEPLAWPTGPAGAPSHNSDSNSPGPDGHCGGTEQPGSGTRHNDEATRPQEFKGVELAGLVRIEGKTRGHIRMYFYLPRN